MNPSKLIPIAGLLPLLFSPAAAQNPPGFGKHPGYTVTNIHPDNITANNDTLSVAGMDFMPNGDMVVVGWKGASTPMWSSNGGRWGRVYLFKGVDGTDRNAIKISRVADNLKDPMGVTVLNGEIYVGDVDRIVKLTNPDANGFYQGKQEIGKWPSSSNGWFEYSFGPLYSNGNFYMAQAVHVKGSGDTAWQMSADRSTVLSIPANGTGGTNYTVVASGFRAPDGIGFGPKGEVFVTDNQGGWLPSCKIIHVVPGRFYGFNALPPSKFQTQPMTQPTVWLTYGTSNGGISHSPTELHAMKAGIFKGHMIFGDVSRGGLYRAYLEQVLDPVTGQPEYQGAVFPFTGGLEAGPHRLKIKDNGDIYMGGLGNGEQTNKGWLGTKFGLQKISAIAGTTAFEMLAVRSRRNGMEIEFTKPAGASADLAANYRAEIWNFVPAACYGCGNFQNRQSLTVSSVQISTDRMRVFLPLTGLKDKGYVVHLTLSNILSQTGEALLYRETEYTLRAISQSDFNPATAVKPEPSLDRSQVRVARVASGNLRVTLPKGRFQVEIADLTGRTLAVRTAENGQVDFDARAMQPGLHLLKVSGQGQPLVKPVFL